MQALKKARSLKEVGSQGMFTSQPRSSSILITAGSESSCHAELAHSISRSDTSARASSSTRMVATRSEALPPTTRTAVASNCRSVRPRSHEGKRFSHCRRLLLLPLMVADMTASYRCTVTASGSALASSRASTVSKPACPMAATSGVRPLNMQGRSGMFFFKAASMPGTRFPPAFALISSKSSRTAAVSPEKANHKSSDRPVRFASSSSCASQRRTSRSALDLLTCSSVLPKQARWMEWALSSLPLAPSPPVGPKPSASGRPRKKTSRCMDQ
mmetsp:Transcript_112427/g.350372  ORF Transcript_112427/g.350372 Transcript_112427/m.350372 type:complete len:272 (-) Transcript_112427:915-1730(-)